MTLLVTGNCGYIGSHVVRELVEDYSMIGFDNLYRGSISNSICATFVGDIRQRKDLENAFEEYNIDTVLHFAALTSVPESMTNKDEYMDVNVEGTQNLLNVMKDYGCNKLIFSSTASLYAATDHPCKESDPIQPLNNYALTKKFCEDLIKHNNDWLNAIVFRYFNVIGFDEDYDMSAELEKTNIVPALYRHIKYQEPFKVFGNTYYEIKRKDSNDHTCVRDYIDVRDIAQAYRLALKRLDSLKGQELYNLGTKTGSSVLEIIKAFEQANNCKVDYTIEKPRKGDPSQVVADNTKAKELLDWTPTYSLVESLKLNNI